MKLDEIFSTVQPVLLDSSVSTGSERSETWPFFARRISTPSEPAERRALLDCCRRCKTATRGDLTSAGVALGWCPDQKQAASARRDARAVGHKIHLEQEVVAQFHGVTRLCGIQPEAVIIERAAAGYGLIDRRFWDSASHPCNS